MPTVTAPFCPTCCTPPAKHCFQKWSASWNCFTLDWTLIPGDMACLPADTDTAWARVAIAGEGCVYERWVDTGEECADDGDCGAVADTDEPDPPANHDDCCRCSACEPADLTGCGGVEDACLSDVPGSIELVIVTAEGANNCSYDGAAPFHVWAVHCAGLAGTSYHLTWDALTCNWKGTFDVLGKVTVDYCVGDGTGCGACVPSTDTLIQAVLTIRVQPGGAVDFQLDVETTDTSLDGGTGGLGNFPMTMNIVHPVSDFETCCDPYGMTGDPSPAGDDWNQVVVTEIAIIPC